MNPVGADQKYSVIFTEEIDVVKYLGKTTYEEAVAKTRDQGMKWWRNARFGMFVHFGIYAILSRNDRTMALENYPIGEYEQLTIQFHAKVGVARKWVQLAKAAGMKYMKAIHSSDKSVHGDEGQEKNGMGVLNGVIPGDKWCAW